MATLAAIRRIQPQGIHKVWLRSPTLAGTNCQKPGLTRQAQAPGTTAAARRTVTSAPGHSTFPRCPFQTGATGRFRANGPTPPSTPAQVTRTAQAKKAVWTGTKPPHVLSKSRAKPTHGSAFSIQIISIPPLAAATNPPQLTRTRNPNRIGMTASFGSNRTAAPSFNGRTPASGAGYRGSNPWGAANLTHPLIWLPILSLARLCWLLH